MKIKVPKTWFDRGYAKLLIYLRDHPGLPIKNDYISEDGFHLGDWMAETRSLWQSGYLTEQQERMLEEIGFSKAEDSQSWESMYRLLRNSMKTHIEDPIELSYRTEEGVMLGAWMDRQQRLFMSLAQEKRYKLQELGLGVRNDEN